MDAVFLLNREVLQGKEGRLLRDVEKSGPVVVLRGLFSVTRWIAEVSCSPGIRRWQPPNLTNLQ